MLKVTIEVLSAATDRREVIEYLDISRVEDGERVTGGRGALYECVERRSMTRSFVVHDPADGAFALVAKACERVHREREGRGGRWPTERRHASAKRTDDPSSFRLGVGWAARYSRITDR